MQAKAASSPSQSKSTQPKPSAQPTRKSFRVAIQSTQKPRKHSGSSKQSPPEIEEIIFSPEELSLQDPEITPEEQGPPKTPAVSKSAASAEPPSKPTLSAPKKSIAKRKLSPKQPPTQGPTEKSPIKPSAKKAKKTAPLVPSSRLAQLLKRSVVRGKIMKVQYFEEQGLGVFLKKLRAQGWLELFANTAQCEERGYVFTPSIDLLVCDQECHSPGLGTQHGRCDGPVLY